MLSSLGFDKNSFRNPRNGASKSTSEAPRGLSVHVFKNPTAPPHSYTASGKPDHMQSLPQDTAIWSRQPSYQSRPSSDRKPSSASNDFHVMNTLTYKQPAAQKQPKSSNGYGIYPSAVGDIYICERSISSASDLLGSPSSSSSSDSELYSEYPAAARTEISSIRASSSTETLETSALAVQRTFSISRSTTPFAPSKTPVSIANPPRVDAPSSTVPGLLAPSAGVPKRSGVSVPAPALPIRLTTAETVSDSDSDSDTVVSDAVLDDPVLNMLGTRRSSDANARAGARQEFRTALPLSTPMRRDSDERAPQGHVRAADRQWGAPASQASSGSRERQDSRMENASLPRAPPGLTATASMSADASAATRAPPVPVPIATAAAPASGAAAAQMPSMLVQGQTSTGSRSAKPPTQPVRSNSNSVGERETPGRPPLPQASASHPGRNSEGRAEPNASLSVPHIAQAMERTLTVASRRCVRWTENLVCPSLVPRCERRKGWFNARGDQLWTNDGRYRSPEPGAEYPPDLAGYPEPNCGWMNEEGTRIDMEHRLIPKPPLRSVLKRPKSAQ